MWHSLCLKVLQVQLQFGRQAQATPPRQLCQPVVWSPRQALRPHGTDTWVPQAVAGSLFLGNLGGYNSHRLVSAGRASYLSAALQGWNASAS